MKIKADFKTAVLVTLIGWSVASVASDIPVVPVDIMRGQGGGEAQNNPVAVQLENHREPTAQDIDESQVRERPVLTMEPGVNEIIPVAIGHPNRLVTPFAEPQVISTSLTGGGGDGECGEVCIRDNVVYVATDKEHPVTMFITESDSEEQALSLTMVPRRIPPREVFLRMKGQGFMPGGFSGRQAERWETSQPYVQTIRSLFRKIAMREVPQGYSINDMPNNIAPPYCDQPGMNVSFAGGQMIVGRHFSVFVGVAQNDTDEPLEFREASCGDWDVAGVTVWPDNVLSPGGKTEVYVARRNTDPRQETGSQRPSLLGRGR